MTDNDHDKIASIEKGFAQHFIEDIENFGKIHRKFDEQLAIHTSVDKKLDKIFNMVEFNTKETAEIKIQTKKTNGRVTANEKWRWGITGGLAVVLAIVVPLFLDLLK